MSHEHPSPPATPYHQHEIHDFFETLDELRKRGICGDPDGPNSLYIPSASLNEYFQDSKQVTRLLRAVFGKDTHLPVDAATVAAYCPKVFSILLLIGHAHLIQQFVTNENLRDTKLPFEENCPSFPPLTGPVAREAALKQFRAKQWQFSAHVFREHDRNIDMRLDSNIILPIQILEPLSPGGTAKLFKVEIDEEYDQLHKSRVGFLPFKVLSCPSPS